MATMYCALCNRAVEATRQVGIGTVVFAVFTAGVSLLAVPFYRKRCSICKSAAVSPVFPEAGSGGPGVAPHKSLAELEQRLRLVEEELEATGGDLRRLQEERDFYRQLLERKTSR